MIGKKLGRYEIVDSVGAGGMGEVYLARDSTLERQVAIKVLPPDFAQDPERLARFEREAKLLAQINHANIAAIYGLEDFEGQRFIAMELIEGESLRQKLSRSGQLDVEETLKITRQLARALEAAHERGVIHRDLKPENVMLTPRGEVKVLDFGLAKQSDGEAATGISIDPASSPTVMHPTQAGAILGTAAYMSPEQAGGQPLDKRTDIWAFGVMLFEMLAGNQAFHGDTAPHVLAEVLKSEPDWNQIPADTPASLRRLLRRCLRKDTDSRMHDIADARLEIEEALDAPEAAETSVPIGAERSRLGSVVPWLLAATGIVVAAIALAWPFRPATR